MYLSDFDAMAGKLNPEFPDWEQQDNILLAWLIASLSENIREKIEKFFASQTRAKIRHLKTQVKNVKKTSSMSQYLLDLKKVVDQLITIGVHVGTKEHIEAILYGLPSY